MEIINSPNENDEIRAHRQAMVGQLTHLGVLQTPAIEEAFRALCLCPKRRSRQRTPHRHV